LWVILVDTEATVPNNNWNKETRERIDSLVNTARAKLHDHQVAIPKQQLIGRYPDGLVLKIKVTQFPAILHISWKLNNHRDFLKIRLDGNQADWVSVHASSSKVNPICYSNLATDSEIKADIPAMIIAVQHWEIKDV
jgi:hypothetical protein